MIATFLDVLDVFRVNILEPSTKESTWSLESSPTSCYWSIPHTNASANWNRHKVIRVMNLNLDIFAEENAFYKSHGSNDQLSHKGSLHHQPHTTVENCGFYEIWSFWWLECWEITNLE